MPVEDYLLKLQPMLDNPINYTVNEFGCKNWRWSVMSTGYGVYYLSLTQEEYLVHRLVLCIKNNLGYHEKFYACHKCDNNRLCFNENHLYVGDKRSNMQDFSRSVTHCEQGHEYTSENTYLSTKIGINGDTNQVRQCRICKKASVDKYRSTQAYKERVRLYARDYRAAIKQEKLLDKM